MTKLLIVDDDQFIREGLKHLIDWDELGIELIGEAEGGNEALRIVEAFHPHILLTDIRMPQGDGLELIEQVRRSEWNTQIIVLSGYNDYKYVRQAIKYQVEDYLLKPVDAHELKEIMKTCCERNRDHWLSEQLKRESFQLLRNNILLRWVENRIDEEQLREKLVFLGIELRRGDWYQSGVITYHDLREGELTVAEEQYRSFAIFKSLDEVLQAENKGTAFLNQQKEIVILLVGTADTTDSFAHGNAQRMLQISMQLAGMLKTPWFCTLGFPQPQANLLHLSYTEARRLQDYIDCIGGPICVDSSAIGQITGSRIGQQTQTAERESIIPALLTGIRELWTEALSRDFHWAAVQADPLSAAKYVATEWVVLIKMALKQQRLLVNDVFVDSKLIAMIYANDTVSNIRSGLLQLLHKVEKAVLGRAPTKKKPIIEQVESYLEEHYADELSLKTLAIHYNVNNIYFGRLFKEETGEYFSDYVNRLRFDKAKELLRETFLTASEIATQVGFPDPNYFFRKFKQITGLSPTEYRNSVFYQRKDG